VNKNIFNNKRHSIKIRDSKGNTYPSARAVSKLTGIHHYSILRNIEKRGYFEFNGIRYVIDDYITQPDIHSNNETTNTQPVYFQMIMDEEGNVYNNYTHLANKLNINRKRIKNSFEKNGYFNLNGVTYYKVNEESFTIDKKIKPILESEPEYAHFKQIKDLQAQPFQIYNFEYTEKECGSRYAVALFSDIHLEETVKPESVLNLNEYNVEIATTRISNYFKNLALCLNADEVDDLIFGALGDTISGYIHDELVQTNGLTPIEATFKAQSLIFSGLKFLCENTNLKSIKFIGIVGNHSRTTKKIQHSNGFKLSYEWLMYKNIEQQCLSFGLPIEFCIPEAELAIVNTPDNKKFIFCHGFQIKGSGNGTVCGIYPALNRLTLKWGKTIKQDKIYIGHFHQCVSIPNAVVNGSIIGYNSFALTNGLPWEEPAQMYEVFDSKIGLVLTRKIYCDK
jgi:hypothetical protein